MVRAVATSSATPGGGSEALTTMAHLSVTQLAVLKVPSLRVASRGPAASAHVVAAGNSPVTCMQWFKEPSVAGQPADWDSVWSTPCSLLGCPVQLQSKINCRCKVLTVHCAVCVHGSGWGVAMLLVHVTSAHAAVGKPSRPSLTDALQLQQLTHPLAPVCLLCDQHS
jgi:hypothetical protein